MGRTGWSTSAYGVERQAGIQGFMGKQESSLILYIVPCFRRGRVWTPACAGGTAFLTFYEATRYGHGMEWI